MAMPTVRDLIGLTQWQRIVELDPEPTFIEMTIAHEGQSRGEIVGWGVRLKEWGKRVIRAVVNAFAPSGKVPVRIYDGLEHWHQNQAQRVPVGEVIHSFGYDAGGLQEARVIGWVYPRFKVIATDRDCCSMEIDGLVVEVNGHSVVEEIYQAVAVVLGHTSKQTPGFAGARVQAITEFGPVEDGPANPVGGATGIEGQTPPPTGAAAAPSAAPTAQVSGVGSQGSGSALAPDTRPPTPTFTTEQLIAAMRAAGIKPTDIWPEKPAAPLPAPVAVPPEAKPQDPIDPLSVAGNPFLPS